MTTIKSAFTNRTLDLAQHAGRTTLNLTIQPDYDEDALGINVPAADLLAAIEAEGIGVVVEGTLPEVTVEGDVLYVDGEAWDRVEYLRQGREHRAANMRRALAIERWLDANPPAPEVDEAQVTYLAAEYHKTTDHAADGGELDRSIVCNCRAIARRIVSITGVHVEAATR